MVGKKLTFCSNHNYGVTMVCAWFLKIAFVCDVGVCVCVSAPEAINYIHMIFYLYNQLNKFVALEM